MPTVKILRSTVAGHTPDSIAATGAITFGTTNPSPGDTIDLNGTTVTFMAAGATGNQVNIGASLTLTLAALLTFLNASADSNIDQCTYGTSSTALTITYKTGGLTGNSFTLAASRATPSASTLTGGGLTSGEIAINEADGILFWLDPGGTIKSANLKNPTAPTKSLGDNTTAVATDQFVQAAIAAVIDGAPSNLNTLEALAAAINDDPAFWLTINNQMVSRLRIDAAQTLNSTQLTQVQANIGLTILGIASILGYTPLSTTGTAANSSKLNGQLPSYYTDITSRLGFTPLNAAAQAVDSAKLGGQLPAYYTNIISRLGFTPLNALAQAVDSARLGGVAASSFPTFSGPSGDYTNGYVQIGPFIINWGQRTLAGASSETVSFTKAFPGNCVLVLTSVYGATNAWASADTYTPSGFNMTNWATGTQAIGFLAIGW